MNSGYVDIKELIIDNIREKLGKLKYIGDSVRIDNVYPALLEDILDGFQDIYDLNGYDCDYWAVTMDGKYKISGCMRYGYANITLNQGEIKPKEKSEEDKANDPYTRTTFKGDWMSFPWENIPPVVPNVDKQKLEELLESGVLSPFYITFPTNCNGGSFYIVLYAKCELDARRRAFSIWQRRWASIYDEEAWKNIKESYKEDFSVFFVERTKPLVLDWK